MLIKYIIGEASVAEQTMVLRWIDASPSNLAYYTELKRTWDLSRALQPSSPADENKAWQKFIQRVHEGEPEPKASKVGWARVAASISIVAALGVIGYMLLNKPGREILVQASQAVKIDSLPDGSVVTINKGSSIAYTSGLKGKSRDLRLKGEAFFNVAPDKKKPFIISVNEVQITVVGTSFNVKDVNGSTEIIVESGIVHVVKGGNSIDLKANEAIQVGAKDSVLAKKGVSDHLYNYYRTKQFVCDDTPLWKLVNVLNEAYSSNIVFADDRLKELKLNTTFDNQSLDQVLNVISLTFDIKIIKEGNSIILQ